MALEMRFFAFFAVVSEAAHFWECAAGVGGSGSESFKESVSLRCF